MDSSASSPVDEKETNSGTASTEPEHVLVPFGERSELAELEGEGEGEEINNDPGLTMTLSHHSVIAPTCSGASKSHFARFHYFLRNFTPSWFAVNMGTGIVSILLYNLPYPATALKYISIVLFAANTILFALFLIVHLLRYVLYPEIWHVMIRHPVQSLFVGMFPIGFATIVNMIAFACAPSWGIWAADMAWALWVVDAVVSIIICMCLPFQLIYKHEAKLETMTATWLLPIVTTIVASASAGIVADAMLATHPERALGTVIAGYILLGTGLPLSMCILTIYFHRLAIHSLPPREVIVSVFLPIGPLGQGAFALMQLGAVAKVVFPKTNTLSPLTGELLYAVGWFIAIIMWGFGLVWLFIALAAITKVRFPFNMGWWGFVFPLGVYATATNTFGKELDSAFFRILGTIFSGVVILLWIVVSIGTIVETWKGSLINAPCLKDLPPGRRDCRSGQKKDVERAE